MPRYVKNWLASLVLGVHAAQRFLYSVGVADRTLDAASTDRGFESSCPDQIKALTSPSPQINWAPDMYRRRLTRAQVFLLPGPRADRGEHPHGHDQRPWRQPGHLAEKLSD